MKLFYAKEVQEDLERYLMKLNKKVAKVRPKVALLFNRDSSESVLYTSVQKKKLVAYNINCAFYPFRSNSKEKSLIDKINQLNDDDSITGISVNFPVPKNVSRLRLFETIESAKDVEGLNPKNMGYGVYSKHFVIPSVVVACYYLIRRFCRSLKGQEITILNDSTLIGKPLAMLLLSDPQDAPTVSILNKYTNDISSYSSGSDVIVTAVGIPGLIKAKHIKNGSKIIDAGINISGGKVRGDVDIKSVSKKAKLVTAVPGGVGVVSQHMFVANVLKLCYFRCYGEQPSIEVV